MGKTSSRVGEYMTLTQDQQALVKQVWVDIENNPQFHGSIFFMGFCETHPQYTKYFTADVHYPLTFDARTNAKFTAIMETMGYLLLDFHSKPKELDRIIGYIAMMHKDMCLARLDMSHFGVSLINYLIVTFPSAMTAECLEITSNYMNNLLDQLSQKIENFQKNEALENLPNTVTIQTPCGSWSLCGEKLIYGQTPAYWSERKARWEERLDEWRIRESTIVQLPRSSSSDDEEIVKSKTEDETSEFAESTARLLESHGIPRTTRIKTHSQKTTKHGGSIGRKNILRGDIHPDGRGRGFRSYEHSVDRRRTTLWAWYRRFHSVAEALRPKPGQRFTTAGSRSFDRERKHGIIVDDDAVPEISASRYNTPRERRRSIRLAETSKVRDATTKVTSLPSGKTRSDSRGNIELPESGEPRVPSNGQRIDSLARQRRRAGQTPSRPP